MDGFNFPLYIGGPVGLDSLHFIHTVPHLIGGELIKDEFYWGGELENGIALIKDGQINASNCKFFLGYSGWSTGQLEDELKMNAWLVTTVSPSLLFQLDDDVIWRQAIESLGKRFNPLLHMPIRADLN
jgi:putative transcriptional regulator